MTARTTVGLNLSWLRPGHVGGTQTYAVRLFEALTRSPQQLCGGQLTFLGIGSHEALDTVDPTGDGFAERLVQQSNSRVSRIIRERTVLGRSIQRFDPTIMHHLGGTAPRIGGGRSIVTIHDLQPLEQPENFSVAKRAFLAQALPRAVQSADLIITPSNYVANRVCERFQLDEHAVSVVPVWAADLPPELADVEVPEASSPFVLYPAMTAPHKNHTMLFEAFRRARRHRPDLRLVCTGTSGSLDTTIRRLASADPHIEMRGHVDASTLRGLLSTAEAVVYPSRFEGFGLPLIEAQALGTVVYSSSATCLPEIMGGAGRLIDPDDVGGWADALADPYEGAALEEEQRRGRENAKRFNPAATARKQLAAYERVLGEQTTLQ